jgi:hypothetical protein
LGEYFKLWNFYLRRIDMNTEVTNKKPTSNLDRKISALDKQVNALNARKIGVSYANIANSLGYRDASGARKAVVRALRATLQEPADELRKLKYEQYDMVINQFASRLLRGDKDAAFIIMTALEKQCKLMGLNLPIQKDKDNGGKFILLWDVPYREHKELDQDRLISSNSEIPEETE